MLTDSYSFNDILKISNYLSKLESFYEFSLLNKNKLFIANDLNCLGQLHIHIYEIYIARISTKQIFEVSQFATNINDDN
ncbi:hypothetical protein BLOT_016133 [Blomia tropicalis]|nr:hypothetical protein BLOT_016133 [Blomia tropicalis]